MALTHAQIATLITAREKQNTGYGPGGDKPYRPYEDETGGRAYQSYADSLAGKRRRKPKPISLSDMQGRNGSRNV